ncbi:SDR family NAD(P)-dependent oxidoreductase [Streptomyces sp. NPDC058695]|uniref:SDR family NAD(P)-dependent oxidoreductase n=1 Tax=Streptomyces sp. NPDC058695 TaxID=3346604 RepID=UPI00364BF440
MNFFATVRVTRAALPALLATRGAIVNVSSIGARVPSSGPIAYTTAKAALTAFGKALAEEFGTCGSRTSFLGQTLAAPRLDMTPDLTDRFRRHVLGLRRERAPPPGPPVT